MKPILEQKIFLNKYNIGVQDFKKTHLNWNELVVIYKDYCEEIPKLEASAIYLFNSLMKFSNVHSVRYRIKDAEHVIEKIIRKKILNPKREINIDNYKTELTDLIGLRALHLFKEGWYAIHELITTTWELKKKPIANYRMGDQHEYINEYKENGCEVKQHEFGYRSVHYIIETKPAMKKYFVEIQVRTIFEEAWGEIDHTIRYPYHQDNPIFGEYLLNFNRLAGNADEMGTFILKLKREFQRMEKAISVIEKKVSKNTFNINDVIKDMLLSIESAMASKWELVQKHIQNYFNDRKLRLELLASLWVHKEISLDFLKKRIADETKILKSEIHSIENINGKQANSAAIAALNTYFEEMLKYNN